MGIQNRDYFRDDSTSGRWSMSSGRTMCQTLLIITVAAYLVQVFFTVSVPDWQQVFIGASPSEQSALVEMVQQGRFAELNQRASELGLYRTTSILESWCALDPYKVAAGQVWRLLTYAFLHDPHGLWHIVFNMWVLWMFGPAIEELWGKREFLAFYLVSAIFAGLFHVLFGFAMHDPSGAVGASGALMAVSMVFAIYYPHTPITVMLLFTLEARWMILLYLIWDLHPVVLAFSDPQRRSDGIAHSAHLGGLLFGYLYHRFGWKLTGFLGQRGSLSLGRRFVKWWNRPRLRVYPTPVEPPPTQELVAPPPSRTAPRDLERQVDVILKKIKEEGEASLTDAERNLLREASQAYKKRNTT